MAYPILLAHGIAPFDEIPQQLFQHDNSWNDSVHYFKEIRSSIESAGHKVFHSRVEWADSVERRADDLWFNNILPRHKQLKTKLNIIAHSMGGLDTRHLIYKYRERPGIKPEDVIASVSTISTPHLGTVFADWGTKRNEELRLFARQFGMNIDGFWDLTQKRTRLFNEKAAEYESRIYDRKKGKIKFFTYAGRQDMFSIFTPLKASYHIIYINEGENDGLVSVRSAKWKKEYFVEPPIDADHLNELGWRDMADRVHRPETENEFKERIKKFYFHIISRLP